MKKKFIFIIILIYISNNIFGISFNELLNKQNLHFSTMITSSTFLDEVSFLSFSDNKIEVKGYDCFMKKLLDHNVCYYYYISEAENFYELNVYSSNYNKNFLMLISDNLIILYDKDSDIPFFIGERNTLRDGGISYIKNCHSSSYLIEKLKEYAPTNLTNFNLNSPWCEGVQGNGIGETIQFDVLLAQGITICNGYISFNKKYLYEQNSRPKKIKINLVDKDVCFEVLLKDTPNPQFVCFNLSEGIDYFSLYTGLVEITILEVYAGSKYDDTCINSIFGTTLNKEGVKEYYNSN